MTPALCWCGECAPCKQRAAHDREARLKDYARNKESINAKRRERIRKGPPVSDEEMDRRATEWLCQIGAR